MFDFCAGIVLFNPCIERLKENITAIYNQVECVFLLDNGSDNIDDIRNLLKSFSTNNIVLTNLEENKGIAVALNLLCANAQKQGFKWIVTLDQDSVSPENLIKEFSKYVSENNVAIICPRIQDRNRNYSIETATGICDVKQCITSGSMLLIQSWSEIGGFDETMFIDGVDFDICNRLIKSGKRIIMVNDVVLLHELGNIQTKRFLLWKVTVKNHSAFRKYYIARNTIYLARKNNTSRLKSYLQIIKQLGICVLYENDKKSKLKKIIEGAKDGCDCEVLLKEGKEKNEKGNSFTFII